MNGRSKKNLNTLKKDTQNKYYKTQIQYLLGTLQ